VGTVEAGSPGVGLPGGSALVVAHVERSQGCTGTWELVRSPQPGTYNVFTAVAALASDEVWAVGQYFDGATYVPLVARWTGSAWDLVAPDLDVEDVALQDVAFSSLTDGWIVGSYHAGSNLATLAMHWDGVAWSRVVAPSPGSASLDDVVTLGPSDAWAVGSWFDGGRVRTLIEHWDGSAWSVVPSVDPSSEDNYLLGVAGTSADLWAVGYTHSGVLEPEHPFIEHWNGTSWSLSYYARGRPARLSDVDVLLSGKAWAVGWNADSDAGLAMTWDGARWRPARTPRPGTSSILYGVDAVSPDLAWAVGDFAETEGEYRPLVEGWNGTRWRFVPSAPAPNVFPQLLAVSAITRNDAWAVGTEQVPNGSQTLVERRCLTSDGW
jgi:hypothetical protein